MHHVDTLNFRGSFTWLHLRRGQPLQAQPRIPCAALTAASVAGGLWPKLPVTSGCLQRAMATPEEVTCCHVQGKSCGPSATGPSPDDTVRTYPQHPLPPSDSSRNKDRKPRESRWQIREPQRGMPATFHGLVLSVGETLFILQIMAQRQGCGQTGMNSKNEGVGAAAPQSSAPTVFTLVLSEASRGSERSTDREAGGRVCPQVPLLTSCVTSDSSLQPLICEMEATPRSSTRRVLETSAHRSLAHREVPTGRSMGNFCGYQPASSTKGESSVPQCFQLLPRRLLPPSMCQTSCYSVSLEAKTDGFPQMVPYTNRSYVFTCLYSRLRPPAPRGKPGGRGAAEYRSSLTLVPLFLTSRAHVCFLVCSPPNQGGAWSPGPSTYVQHRVSAPENIYGQNK
ncbi:uncharacterized protein LOC109490461 [Ailuropoda melanoleuca]|uniref:uncharacterized protein LOC109490461 n=1 Tax=Ailuropoda melanoleuca TaxID=9646 RepID=UPI0014942A94|nr:uncharacterized protein LOC109490461 [Ailuropoda melanoleuca]